MAASTTRDVPIGSDLTVPNGRRRGSTVSNTRRQSPAILIAARRVHPSKRTCPLAALAAGLGHYRCRQSLLEIEDMHLGKPRAIDLLLEDADGISRELRRLAGLVDDGESP